MKALEILKRTYKTPQDFFRYSNKEIEDSIKELEELQKEIIEKDLKIKDLESYFYGVHTVKKH